MAKYNMPNARSLYTLMSANNPALPSLGPWLYRKYTTMSPMSFVRNPYYFAVDEEGRQLPYIDRLQLEFIDSMMVPLGGGERPRRHAVPLHPLRELHGVHGTGPGKQIPRALLDSGYIERVADLPESEPRRNWRTTALRS